MNKLRKLSTNNGWHRIGIKHTILMNIKGVLWTYSEYITRKQEKKNNAKLILKASVYVHNAEKGTWRKPKPNSNLSSVSVENLNFNNRHITAVPILNPQVIIICSLLEEHWCNSYCFSCLAYCIHCTCRPQFYSYVSEKTEFKFLQGALRDHYVSVE